MDPNIVDLNDVKYLLGYEHVPCKRFTYFFQMKDDSLMCVNVLPDRILIVAVDPRKDRI